MKIFTLQLQLGKGIWMTEDNRDEYRRILSEGGWKERVSLCRKLGQLKGDSDATELLIGMLRDKSYKVQAEASKSIEKLGVKQAASD